LDILDGYSGDNTGGVDIWYHRPKMNTGGHFFAAGAADPQAGGVFGS